MNRAMRRSAARECQRYGHVTKTGWPGCLRCGVVLGTDVWQAPPMSHDADAAFDSSTGE